MMSGSRLPYISSLIWSVVFVGAASSLLAKDLGELKTVKTITDLDHNIHKRSSHHPGLGYDCNNHTFNATCMLPEDLPSCIPENWMCNGFPNCADELDEENCFESDIFCEQEQRVIRGDLRCNGHFNCADGQDEANCTCSNAQFECTFPRKCIPDSYVCDKVISCTDMSDEQGCTCAADEFACNKYTHYGDQCMNLLAVCDGVEDCRDSSDEASCPGSCAVGQTRCAVGGSFAAGNSPCIPISKVCDDTADCADHSDESQCDSCSRLGRMRCLSNYKDPATKLYKEYVCLKASSMCDNDQHCLEWTIDEHDSCCWGMEQNFRCYSQDSCISNNGVCDGFLSCNFANDECGCSSPNLFYVCQLTGKCVGLADTCDGDNDCGHPNDWTDECFCNNAGPTSFCTNTNRCLAPHQICDDVNDCGDFSDEANCTSCNYHPAGEFQCLTYSSYADMCVGVSEVCNGDADCRDGSDEADCYEPCEPDEVRCATGVSLLEGFPRCLPFDLWCDDFADCLDHSDEDISVCERVCPYNPVLNLRRCISAEGGNNRAYVCINDNNSCDNYTDCVNGLDEVDCPCPDGEFNCDGNRCLLASRQCDNSSDCRDDSDENNCGPCNLGSEFECQNTYCLPAEAECNGIIECADGSDERVDCPTTPPHIEPSTTTPLSLSTPCPGAHCNMTTENFGKPNVTTPLSTTFQSSTSSLNCSANCSSFQWM